MVLNLSPLLVYNYFFDSDFFFFQLETSGIHTQLLLKFPQALLFSYKFFTDSYCIK